MWLSVLLCVSLSAQNTSAESPNFALVNGGAKSVEDARAEAAAIDEQLRAGDRRRLAAQTPVDAMTQAASFMTMFWNVWHKRYVDIRVANNQPVEANFAQVSQSFGSSTPTTLGQGAPIDALSKDRLKDYWQYLNTASLANQPVPRAKNVEMHSDGIINGVMTASVAWDHPDDEAALVSKFWFRFSSDCTDLGRINPTFPPVLVLDVDAIVPRYKTALGPVTVPDNAQCLMVYVADKMGQPFPNPVAVPLPQFRYPNACWPQRHVQDGLERVLHRREQRVVVRGAHGHAVLRPPHVQWMSPALRIGQPEPGAAAPNKTAGGGASVHGPVAAAGVRRQVWVLVCTGHGLGTDELL